jgi:CRISPR-associated protein Csm1
MFSCDISGIQQFIYTISSEKALKALRSRSFYLEIMMENLIDEILEKIGLSRANLIYSGGGHCYILLPIRTKSK